MCLHKLKFIVLYLIGPYRGPSRAKKYKKLRLNQPRKVQVLIPKELGAVVGDKAKQFVAECSDWVKMICRIDVESWRNMLESNLNQLYTRIKVLSFQTLIIYYLFLTDISITTYKIMQNSSIIY